MNLSIIVPTRNKAVSLKETLDSMHAAVVPDGITVELLVVDNGSTDGTDEVVRAARIPGILVRHVWEEHPGLSWARNRGLEASTGEMILFVDNDVRPNADWLVALCDALRRNAPCAVAGSVTMAPHLERPWMTPLHRSWLSTTEWLDPVNPRSMVGANMGFSRDVLRHVAGFDLELGPGALGFGCEELFASQLLEAGFRIHAVLQSSVEHHFDPDRLLRQSWLDAAIRRGHSHAYRGHHWEHWDSRFALPRYVQALSALTAWRLRNGGQQPAEGCSVTELELTFRCALLRAHLRERHRPRNYARHGLVKLEPARVHALAADAVPAMR